MVDIDDDKNMTFEELEKFLMDIIDELEERHDRCNHGSLEVKTQLLVDICSKLWKEKGDWRQMFFKIADRYNTHLNKETEILKKMLPRSMR